MNLQQDLIITFVGLIVITVLTRVIAAKIKNHLSKQAAHFIYLFTALLGVYYLTDIFLNNSLYFNNIYIYFWVIVIIVQLLFFIQGRKKHHE